MTGTGRITVMLAGLFLAAAWAGSAPAADGKDDFPPFAGAKLKLTEGERLTYQVKWGAIDAGTAVLSVKRKELDRPGGSEVWNIQCRTRSNGFVSMFYEVRDDIKTLIDAQEGCARLFVMDKNEGSVHVTERIEFDYDKNQARYTKVDKTRDTTKDKAVPLPGKVHDPLSCLYYVRTMEGLKVGDERKFTVNTSKKNWVMTLKVLRSESLYFDGPIGKVNCLVVEPEAQFQGIFVRKGKMLIWLEEKTRIPLMLKAELPIGSATATLVKAENSPLSKPADAGKK